MVSAHGPVTQTPQKDTYHYGDEVTLSVAAEAGWTFTDWTPALTDNKVTISGDTVVTANFTQNEYTLTVNSAHGTVTQTPQQATYHYGDEVTLTLGTVDPGWTFTDWTPALTDNKVTITGDTTVTANFTQNEYTLTVNSAHGTVTQTPQQATYHYGDEVTLSVAAEAGWTFADWTPALTDNKVTITGDTTVTANFTQNEYTLTIVSAHGIVTQTPQQATYHYGDEVTLSVAAEAGWTFTDWTPALTGDKVTISGDTIVTANFTQDEYTLTIDIIGSGTVVKDPDQATYHYGDTVQITATAAESWDFTGWSGDIVSTASPYYFVVDGNKNITATFRQLALPAATTQAVTDITTTTATGNGNITDLGAPLATQYGVVWDTAADPTIALSTRTEQGVPAGTGAFTSAITGLTPGTLYHVRAYATNSQGTVYGQDVMFTTLLTASVTTQAVTDITSTSATGNGSIDISRNPESHRAWRGLEYITQPHHRGQQDYRWTRQRATGPFTSNITELTAGTLYHVRAYATNAAGTAYGEEVTFTTLFAPTVTTQAVTAITTTPPPAMETSPIFGSPDPTEHGVVWSIIC